MIEKKKIINLLINVKRTTEYHLLQIMTLRQGKVVAENIYPLLHLILVSSNINS